MLGLIMPANISITKTQCKKQIKETDNPSVLRARDSFFIVTL